VMLGDFGIGQLTAQRFEADGRPANSIERRASDFREPSGHKHRDL
jgi:hypothetical protein